LSQHIKIWKVYLKVQICNILLDIHNDSKQRARHGELLRLPWRSQPARANGLKSQEELQLRKVVKTQLGSTFPDQGTMALTILLVSHMAETGP
jgi:hypothetical protein